MKKHNYVFELIEDCKGLTRKEMCEREKYWIAHYQTYGDKNKGYNLTPGGDGAAEGIHNNSAKLNEEQIKEVYDLLINHLEIYIYEIAQKYNISVEAISDINNGRRYINPLLNYPLRPAPTPKVESGIKNHLAKIKSEKVIQELIEDLKHSELTLQELAKVYNLSYATISNINRGLRYYNKELNYPIRKVTRNFVLSPSQQEEVAYQLIHSNKPIAEIAKDYGVSVDTIYRINRGKRQLKKNYIYPLRANQKSNKAVSTILVSEEQSSY